MVPNDYGVRTKPITARNPHANAIIERVHQTIGNMFRTMELQHHGADIQIGGVLAAAMFANEQPITLPLRLHRRN